MERGWIRLWRKSLDSQVFQNEGLWQLFSYCLMRAAHKEQWVGVKTGRGSTTIKLKPGEFIFGRHQAAKDLRCKPSTVADRLKKLEKLQKAVTQPGTHYTIVSIVNLERYQGSGKNSDTQPVTHPTPNRHPTDTNKNDKNEKNEKKEERGAPKKARRCTLPADFSLNDEMRAYATGKGISDDMVAEVFESFRNHHICKANINADWPAAFRLWCDREKKFHPERNPDDEFQKTLRRYGYADNGPLLPILKAPSESEEKAERYGEIN
jgi:hypothetical protein